MKQCVIVGGGIAGLAAARRLRAVTPDLEITLIESDVRLGGKILTEHHHGFTVEGAADSFLSRKPRGVGLCRELGIDGRLRGRRPEHARTYVRFGGRLHRLPEGLSGLVPTDIDRLADTTLLSTAGRARIAQEPEIPPRLEQGDESIAAFMTRRLGSEAYERLIEPLLSGIYGGNGSELSLDATFPMLRDLELHYGSVVRGLEARNAWTDQASEAYPPFVSFPEGMIELVDALVEQLDAVRLRSGESVAALHEHDAPNDGAPRLTVSTARSGAIDADAVILTTPAHVTARLVEPIDEELARLHRGIEYGSCATISLAYSVGANDPPPSGYGYLVPRVEDTDVLACTVSSNKWENRAPDDHLLVRVYVGRTGRSNITVRTDDELTAMATDELGDTLGFRKAPEWVRIYRWPESMPQYTMGHRDRISAIDACLAVHPGLFVGGAAYDGVGIPDCIASGERAAERCAAGFAGVTPKPI